MQRRNFLKISGITPFMVNGFSVRPFANRRMAKILSACDGIEDRVLILIQLKGGNDGVNTLVPINQYDLYANLRPVIKIPDTGPEKFINLDSTLPTADEVGLHPVMTGIKALYDQGKAAVVQAVGYENINGSHFKGTDLWLSGGDGTQDNFHLRTGWMGRALQAMYPDVVGVPTTDMPDPLGIQLGDPYPSLGFHTETEHVNAINLYGQDPEGFYSLVQTIGGAPLPAVPASEYGDELAYIMGVEDSVDQYSVRITECFNAGSNAISTYPDTGLANQLKTIARLIKGGCKTKIYLCSMGGFDTHGNQIPPEGTVLLGGHATLLQRLSDAIKTFMDDLQGLGLADQVVACTFSEFGRTARENGAAGTDHGTLAPMLLFGKDIKAGVVGTNVDLSNLTDDDQLQGMQYDYRQVFTTLLQDWLGASNYVLEQTMFEGYGKLPLIDPAAVVDPDCYFGTTGVFDGAAGRPGLTVYPNPATVSAEVRFVATSGAPARITVHSLGGAVVRAHAMTAQPGANTFFLNVRSLPPATYFVRVEIGRQEMVTKLIVCK